MSWSSTYKQKLQDRVKLINLCEEDREARVIAKELCRRDVKYFINNFCWTFDPRPNRAPHHFPFILYPVQENYLDWRDERYTNQEDGLTDKSRDMGVTWSYLAWDLHKWLFADGFHALLGSRTQDKVDKYGEPDCLFWKLDYLLKRLPKWFLPEFDKDKHRSALLLKNPVNGNAISGESANPEFSRQGRYSVVDMDEFAFWPFASSSWTASSEATTSRFPVSTPKGKNNKFADLKFNSVIKTISLHWKDHPLKDQAWYEKQKERKTPLEMAQELDIDYEVSGGELWLPWYRANSSTIEVQDPIKVPPGWKVYASIDNHPRKPSSCHFYAVDFAGRYYSVAELYERSSVEDMADWMKAKGQRELLDRCEWIVADPQLWAEDQEIKRGNPISRALLFKQQGIRLIPGVKGHDVDARERTRDLILAGKVFLSPLCKMQRWEFGEALRWDEYSEQIGQKRGVKETLADKNNHAWDDWKYFILKNPKAPAAKPPPETVGLQARMQSRLAQMDERKKGWDPG